MALFLIAAVDSDGAIGHNNALPWERIKADLMHFKTITTGHTVVMGRTTFESIGFPLPNRTNIVLTRNATYAHEGVLCISDPAIVVARAQTEDVFVIGGAEIYQLLLPHVTRMYITTVDTKTGGTIFFPPVDWSVWKKSDERALPIGTDTPYPLRFTTWDRATNSAY
jgi:dihydrofolate reductase